MSCSVNPRRRQFCTQSSCLTGNRNRARTSPSIIQTQKGSFGRHVGVAKPRISADERPLGFSNASHRVSISIAGLRSEEHTSELQSHLNLVCRLLLEKKKK